MYFFQIHDIFVYFRPVEKPIHFKKQPKDATKENLNEKSQPDDETYLPDHPTEEGKVEVK